MYLRSKTLYHHFILNEYFLFFFQMIIIFPMIIPIIN